MHACIILLESRQILVSHALELILNIKKTFIEIMLKIHWAGKVGAGRSKKSIPFRTQKKKLGPERLEP